LIVSIFKIRTLLQKMWYEERNQFVRAPVPKSFDLLVKKLQDNDSVLFESISLPSLVAVTEGHSDSRTPRSKTALTPRRDPIIDLSDDFLSDDEDEAPAATTVELQLRALLDRVHELEADNKKKDDEIAFLRQQLGLPKLRRSSAGDASNASSDALFYKTQYEMMKVQCDKLKEALTGEAKGKKVPARPTYSHKLSA
jgi:hypothetical protein